MKKDGKRTMTPEEAFDRRMLSENYRMFLIVCLFLVVGVEAFLGLMSTPVVIGVAALVGILSAGFLAGPLFWELDTNNRSVRRIRRAAFFPICIKNFIFSKWKIMAMYGGVLWLFSLAVQLVSGPLFGFGNILLYQGALAAVFVVNMIVFTVLGTAGAKLGE